MYCLLLVISDSALLPLSATGGGHKATPTELHKQKTIYTNRVRRLAVRSDNMKTDRVITAMIEYFGSDKKRIHHFLKVYSFAKTIGESENLLPDDQELLEISAIVHDIGIKVSEEKYNSSAGKYQELEGPHEAEKLLAALGYEKTFIDKVCYLVGNHHTYGNIDTLPYRILVEADFLVNLYEDDSSRSAAEQAYDKIFRTNTGKNLLKIMFLIP
jgi:uncharacterized protein